MTARNFLHACNARSLSRLSQDPVLTAKSVNHILVARAARPPQTQKGCLYTKMAGMYTSTVSDLEEPLGAGLVNKGQAVSPISDATLRKYNIAGMVLHFVQGTAMLVASQAVTNIKAFKKMLTMSFLRFDEQTQALVPDTRNVFNVEIGVAAAVFVLLSAVAHALVLVFWKQYIADINRGINKLRWFEYALSSSVMICSIAILFGCYDIGSLILMFFINACMNFYGLLMEQMNPPDRVGPVDWSPFVYGCIAGVAPWIVVCLYFFGSGNYSQIPGFVYGILGGCTFFIHRCLARCPRR